MLLQVRQHLFFSTLYSTDSTREYKAVFAKPLRILKEGVFYLFFELLIVTYCPTGQRDRELTKSVTSKVFYDVSSARR